jgi:DNA-binding GntR family transcriptional regulator
MVNDDVYSLLRDLILREEVLPNERLIESDYAERFNTNRSSIRKALATLEREGLVVIEPFKGAHVRRITDKEAIEMTEVRTALESLLVRYAAERAGDADKENLRQAQAHARALLQENSPIEVGGAARRVREWMWQISGHATGHRILVTINSQLIRIWFRAIMMPGRAQEIVDQLDPVVDAICDNDPERAVAAMRAYHTCSMAALMRAVQLASAHSTARHLPL